MIERIRVAIREAINRRRDHLDTSAAPVRMDRRDPERQARAAEARQALRDR